MTLREQAISHMNRRMAEACVSFESDYDCDDGPHTEAALDALLAWLRDNAWPPYAWSDVDDPGRTRVPRDTFALDVAYLCDLLSVDKETPQ